MLQDFYIKKGLMSPSVFVKKLIFLKIIKNVWNKWIYTTFANTTLEVAFDDIYGNKHSIF